MVTLPSIRRVALATAALAVAAGSAAGAQRSLREQTVYVSVVDRQGKPAEGLSAGDFTVREDGAAREVLTVGPATGPLQVAVLVDPSEASRNSIPDIRESVKAFAGTIWAANPESQIALYAFGERPTLEADYTSNAATLARNVDRLFASTNSGAYFIEAVIEAATALGRRSPARGVVVAFVDENGPEFSNRRHQQVFDAVAAARASLWTITRQGFSDNPMASETRERASVLGDVTQRTGGRNVIIFAPSALRERFVDVATQLLTQTAITYGRPDSLIPPERLEVRLTRDGYRLAAPRWTGR